MDRLYKHEDVVQMLVDVIEQAEQNNDIVIVDRPMGWECIRDYAEEVVSDIPSAEPWDIYNFDEWCTDCKEYDTENHRCPRWNKVIRRTLEENQPKQEWIPCSERLPDDIRPVLVTWKNNDPASYYQYIVGKHFIGTAHYHRGKWYWYSSVTEDLLAEYGKCETEEFDEAIEAVAWMPLPEPWEGADNDSSEV